jgi:hypothetical protein
MPGEAFHQPSRTEIIEAFVLERRRERPQPRFLLAHGHGADRGGEHQPSRRSVLGGALWPGEARAADQPAIHAHRVRPVERDG